MRQILLLLLLFPVLAFGQASPPSTYVPQLITYQGVPFGVCSVYQIAENVTNGNYYTCNISTNSWQTVSGSSGLSFVSSLPTLCTPGVTASVQLSVAPFTINYCSATNTWTTVSGTFSGSIATNQVAVGTGANTLGGSNNFLYNPSNGVHSIINPGVVFAAPTVTPATAGGTTWCYTIQARQGIVDIATSAEGCTSTGTATLTTLNNNGLAWIAPPGATVYDVFLSTNSVQSNGYLGTTAATSFTDTGIAANGGFLMPPEGGFESLNSGIHGGNMSWSDVWNVSNGILLTPGQFPMDAPVSILQQETVTPPLHGSLKQSNNFTAGNFWAYGHGTGRAVVGLNALAIGDSNPGPVNGINGFVSTAINSTPGNTAQNWAVGITGAAVTKSPGSMLFVAGNYGSTTVNSGVVGTIGNVTDFLGDVFTGAKQPANIAKYANFYAAEGTLANAGAAALTAAYYAENTGTGAADYNYYQAGGHSYFGNNAIGTTPTDSIQLINPTVAAAGAQQYAPAVHWQGQGWKTSGGASSQNVDFRSYVIPVQGAANPSATWQIESSINGGAYANPLTYTSAGVLSSTNSILTGTDNSAAGAVQVANGSAAAHTIFTSAATTTNTIAGFTAVPANGDIVTCTVVVTTCTLTDGGPAGGTPAFPVTVTGGVSGAVPCFTATTTESAGTLLTSNSPVLGGGAGVCPSTKTFLTTDGAAKLTVGVAGGGNGVLALAGNTSGTATLTAPAVAGTTTNPVISSNNFEVPPGALATPGILFNEAGVNGVWTGGNGSVSVVANSADAVFFGSTQIRLGFPIGFVSSTPNASALDTAFSRDAADVMDVGNGTAADVTGTMKGAAFLSAPTTHALTVPITIGSGTSIGSTTLCAAADCPAGTYVIPTYIDITTACGTSGTYIVNLIYTDDQGAKTIVVNINGTGSVPATGTLTTTSTANYGENSQVIHVTSGNINYSTTAAACGTAGPMVGKLYMVANRVI